MASTQPTLKLLYFDLPGKAEPTRLCAHIGGFELEDVRVTFAEWSEHYKPSVQPMQLPVLWVNGEPLGQSVAQTRYIANLAGLYPKDPEDALRADELIDYVQELFIPLGKAFTMQDEAEKMAYRAAMVAEGGDMWKWIVLLDQRLEGRDYAVGDSLTVADIDIFCTIQPLRSEWLEGVSPNCLDSFKNIQRHRDLIANLDQVKSKYENATGIHSIFKP